MVIVIDGTDKVFHRNAGGLYTTNMYNSEGYLVQYYLDTTIPNCYERKVNLSNDNVTDTDITIVSWNIIYADDSISGGNTYPANNVSYDNTESGLTSDNAQDAIDEVVANFQDGVDSIYDACVAKGSTPASKSLSDVVQGIENIETGITPTGTINITSNGTKDVTNYASANVNVPNSNSGTFTATTRSTKIDMGAANTYRYVNTNSVPNSNSTTYTTTTRENKDLGAANTYRYVNTSNMPNVNSTTYTATTRATKIDLGAANTYRYLVTSGVPNSNSTTYTYGSGSTGATVNMGADNTYRYVNAAKVYTKGVSDGRSLTSESLSWTVPSGADRWETHTFTFSFATKVVGVTKIRSGVTSSQEYSIWHGVPYLNISGKTVTVIVNGTDMPNERVDITAVGY